MRSSWVLSIVALTLMSLAGTALAANPTKNVKPGVELSGCSYEFEFINLGLGEWQVLFSFPHSFGITDLVINDDSGQVARIPLARVTLDDSTLNQAFFTIREDQMDKYRLLLKPNVFAGPTYIFSIEEFHSAEEGMSK